MAARLSYRVTVSTSTSFSVTQWFRSKKQAREFCRKTCEQAPGQGFGQLGFQLCSRSSAKAAPKIELAWLWTWKSKEYVVVYSFEKDGKDVPVLCAFADKARAWENYNNVPKRCKVTGVKASDLRILHDGAQVWPKA